MNKEIEKDTGKWRGISHSWVSERNIVKMTTLPTALYSSNTVIVKVSTKKRNILTKTKKKCPKYLWIQKSPWINKAHLGGKNHAGGIALPEFKINCRAIGIKTVCYWHKDRHDNRVSEK